MSMHCRSRRARGALLGLTLASALAVTPWSPVPAAEEAEEKAAANYLKLHPDFIVNLHTSGHRPRFLLAAIQVMSRESETIEAASQHLPALRHQLLLLLSDQSYDSLADVEARKALQDQALEVVNEVLERETRVHSVEGLYFTQFVVE